MRPTTFDPECSGALTCGRTVHSSRGVQRPGASLPGYQRAEPAELPSPEQVGDVGLRPQLPRTEFRMRRGSAGHRHRGSRRSVVIWIAALSVGVLLAGVLTIRLGSRAASGEVASPRASERVPVACADNGSYVWSHLVACGWPGPTNTGPSVSSCAGKTLAVNSGSPSRVIHVTTPNSLVSCQNVTGCLSIEAAHVTVRNVKIACRSGRTGTNANGTSVISVNDGASATIDHVEINGMSGVHACIWHQGTALTARAVNCYGVDDGIFSWADTHYSATTGDHFTI
jgi:hypothetical protein